VTTPSGRLIHGAARAYTWLMRRPLALLCLALIAGCGGGGDDDAEPKAKPAGPSPESVVRGWAEDLRSGDVDAASARFAIPSIVANGTPEIRLETPQAVQLFNNSLPCGGRVTKTTRRHGLVIATFELTERPGGHCDGVGHRAKTAFEVKDGKITRWLRVPVEGEGANPPGEVV
jgi:hypothetical protein